MPWRVVHIIVGCWLLLFPLLAVNIEHENVLRVSFGGAWVQDQYLSPLLYKGYRVGIGNEWWQPFRRTENRVGSRWEHVGSFDVKFAWMYNPVKSNVIYSLGLRGGWGAYYLWSFDPQGVRLLLGPYLDIDYAGRLHGRSVNKPYSMDIAADVDVMAGVRYVFKGKKTSYRLQYLCRANLIGVDYMPDYWQSYYEMTEGVLGRVRCSGMWNHRMIRHALTLDMQFPHSTWRVGVEHSYLEYGIKGMMFSREQVSLVVGTVFRYRLRPNHNLVLN